MRVRSFLANTGILVAAAGVGLLAAIYRNQAQSSPEDPPVAATPPLPVLIDTISGSLESPLALGGDSARVVVYLRSRDCLTCEDLGRQLRELRRVAGEHGVPLIIASDLSGIEDVRWFSHKERLGGVAVMQIDTMGRSWLAKTTPAAVTVDNRRLSYLGIGHPTRVANMRLRSFADELEDIGAFGDLADSPEAPATRH